MNLCYKLIFLNALNLALIEKSFAQNDTTVDSTNKFKVISAGPQYKRSGWHDFFWGKNYRKEWSTPVKLPVFLLNENEGGLNPVKEGGGHQTTSLHLETQGGKNYTLRSVDKRLGKVLPENFKGTFVERQVNDEVSMSYPYAAVTVSIMEQQAGIYHTNPGYVYLPKQEALDSFSNEFENKVYLFEQRLKGDWSNADNLGNFKEFFSTWEVMDKLQDETENHVDQEAYIKARLFDMLIADWDRHEDQWGWGEVKKGNQRVFIAVPQDRDQAYFAHHGKLLDALNLCFGHSIFSEFERSYKSRYKIKL